jgi:hypothetical protein
VLAAFAAEPTGQFDLVICTHTLSLIPLPTSTGCIGRLYGFATKAVFIAEKIGDRKKGEVADPGERAIGWTVSSGLTGSRRSRTHARGRDGVFESGADRRRDDHDAATGGGRRAGSEVAGPR